MEKEKEEEGNHLLSKKRRRIPRTLPPNYITESKITTNVPGITQMDMHLENSKKEEWRSATNASSFNPAS